MPNSSDLHEVLGARGVDTLIVTGTVTNVCCETTARDGHMLGYKIVFVSDGTAAFSDEEHNASLLNMTTIFGEVQDTEGTLALFR
jgi:ureidoacrylate peracid hydrolase